MERKIRGRMGKYVKRRKNGSRRRKSGGGILSLIPTTFGLRRMVRKLA